MTNFLIAGLFLFLLALVGFSLIFVVAIHFRLLEVEPELQYKVDSIFGLQIEKPETEPVVLTGSGKEIMVKKGYDPLFGAALAATASMTFMMPAPQMYVWTRVQNVNQTTGPSKQFSTVTPTRPVKITELQI